MTLLDVLMAIALILSGVSFDLIGEKNSFQSAYLASHVVDEEMVEWTIINEYESGEAIASTINEGSIPFRITVQESGEGGGAGCVVDVEDETTHNTDQLFIPQS